VVAGEAGDRESGLEIDVTPAGCNASACKAFRLVRDDTPEMRARKVVVLKQACGRKLAEACTALSEAVPHAKLLTLACGTEATCGAVLRNWARVGGQRDPRECGSTSS
jgi:hypothetical protein